MDDIIASPAMLPALPPALSSALPSSSQSTYSPPSSPLSEFSKTPSPPLSPLLSAIDPSDRYPSPSATSQSGGASPRKMDRDGEGEADGDGPPPAKRRRVLAPLKRPRMTRYLDLNDMDDSEACDEELGHLLRALRKKKKIVVIAGAGISVSAGIPDFRSSTGLFTTLRGQHGLKGSGKHLFDASVYKHDSSTSSFHSMVRELAHMTQTAKPTPFHHMLASIAHEGRLMRLYSQNVDCIDTNMQPLATNVPLNIKGPWPTTVQLHGGLAKMVCSKCGQLEDFDGSLFEGPEPPPCVQCTTMDQVRTRVAGKRSHGIGRLRPRIVLYNEYNPDEEAIGNVSKADLRRGADAVIVVGTSLKIPGVRRLVKELCHTTRSRRDGFTAWINVDSEPQGAEFKDCWDLVVHGSSDDVARLAGLPRWDGPDIGSPSHWSVTGSENMGAAKLQVVLEPSSAASSPTKAHSGFSDDRPIKEDIDDSSKTVLPSLARNKITQKVSQHPSSSATASMPTPTSSPKPPRKRLPVSRQSKLPFQQVTKDSGEASPPAKTGGEKTKVATKNSTKSDQATLRKTKVIKKGSVAAKRPAAKRPAAKQVGKSSKAAGRAKKEDKTPTPSIALTFRATKNAKASTPNGKPRKPLPLGRMQRPATSDEPKSDPAECSALSGLSDLPSPPDSVKQHLTVDLPLLPDLRDSGAELRSALTGKENGLSGRATNDEPTPRTPPPADGRRASNAETISPQSVPRNMGPLID